MCRGDEPPWSKLTAEYVTDFVLRQVAVVRAEKGRIVTAVRLFLHFLTADGIVPRQLIRAIPRIRRWRYADLPKRLSAEQLDVVLKACQSEEYGSLRDRAFITLFARLGVRAGKLGTLRMEDIDWTQGLVDIRQSKTGRGRNLPLAEDAGKLLVKYMREARTATTYREVFLTSVTPRQPLGDCVATTFGKIFLLQAGVDIAVIALWPGHESIETTHGYVEADLEMKQRASEKLTPATGTVSRF